MNQQTYESHSEGLLKTAHSIEESKRPAYTQGDVDVLKNFKEAGRRMGVSALQAWGVHFNKHIDAINSYAKDPTAPQAEGILGRFADAINYLKLGWALVQEYEAPRAVSAVEIAPTHPHASVSIRADGQVGGCLGSLPQVDAEPQLAAPVNVNDFLKVVPDLGDPETEILIASFLAGENAAQDLRYDIAEQVAHGLPLDSEAFLSLRNDLLTLGCNLRTLEKRLNDRGVTVEVQGL